MVAYGLINIVRAAVRISKLINKCTEKRSQNLIIALLALTELMKSGNLILQPITPRMLFSISNSSSIHIACCYQSGVQVP